MLRVLRDYYVNELRTVVQDHANLATGVPASGLKILTMHSPLRLTALRVGGAARASVAAAAAA